LTLRGGARSFARMEQLLTALPVLIFSIVLHEVAHGWVAQREGDPTAAMLGRLTLNPIPHIDPVGSLLVPTLLILTNFGFIFGWAKPVPVNTRNFRNYRRGDILVSLAGVAANFLLAIFFTFLLAVCVWAVQAMPDSASFWLTLMGMANYGIAINFILILFNLLPIPPLDGSHVMYHLLPPQLGMRYREIGRYGMLLIFAFLFLGGFQLILLPPLRFLISIAQSVAFTLA
jgi:Zn-dependent protease